MWTRAAHGGTGRRGQPEGGRTCRDRVDAADVICSSASGSSDSVTSIHGPDPARASSPSSFQWRFRSALSLFSPRVLDHWSSTLGQGPAPGWPTRNSRFHAQASSATTCTRIRAAGILHQNDRTEDGGRLTPSANGTRFPNPKIPYPRDTAHTPLRDGPHRVTVS